ncbi:helix-turn-helix transcriptional regulator, partial [Streptomyces clavuligerus]
RFTEPVLALRTPDELLPGQLTGTAVHPPSGPVGYVVTFTPDRVLRPGTARRRAHHLSPTGARILEGIAAGASTDQLASRLCLSRQGVVYHVTGMMRALDAPNRAALVARAQFLGLLTVGTWPPRVVPECVHETGHRRQAQGGRPHDGAIGGRPGR